MPTPSLIVTIAPDRCGKPAMRVSLPNADGTQSATPRKMIPVTLDKRLVDFVDAAQAFAWQQLAAVEAAPIAGGCRTQPVITDELDPKHVGQAFQHDPLT
jgi:hypothetical protein